VLHAFVAIEGGPTRLRRILPVAYALGGLFCILALTGPLMMADVVRTGWGWGYQVGGAYSLFYLTTLAAVGLGYTLLGSMLGSATLEADLRQRPFVVASMVVPLFVASTTDVLLPMLGIQVLHLGTASFAVLGVLTVSNVIRFGYSMIVPSSFSDEILATLPDGVALLHPNRRIRTANEGLARLSGHPRSELERMEIGDVLECDLESRGEEPRAARGRLRTSGEGWLPVTVVSRAVRDRQDNALGLVVSVRDLREVELLRSRLVDSDRLAAVGQLAAGIAHEINNPLAFVRANLSHLEGHWKRLREPLRRGEEIPAAALRDLTLETDELIEESLEGVDRAAAIIRSVRSFAHAGTDAREPADLNDLLDQALVMAGPRLRGRIEVERDYAELPLLTCSVQQMKQVFLNLLVNAVQALAEGGTVRLRTRSDLGFVEVEVEDDGPGMSDGVRTRIFDPFFTTKPVGEGTGLGLGIAHEIVRSHGGSIEVDSQPGEGARFRIQLPLQVD
jgi:two-component system NtrC family sensor kinase